MDDATKATIHLRRRRSMSNPELAASAIQPGAGMMVRVTGTCVTGAAIHVDVLPVLPTSTCPDETGMENRVALTNAPDRSRSPTEPSSPMLIAKSGSGFSRPGTCPCGPGMLVIGIPEPWLGAAVSNHQSATNKLPKRRDANVLDEAIGGKRTTVGTAGTIQLTPVTTSLLGAAVEDQPSMEANVKFGALPETTGTPFTLNVVTVRTHTDACDCGAVTLPDCHVEPLSRDSCQSTLAVV
jgi:hypothetical protein